MADYHSDRIKRLTAYLKEEAWKFIKQSTPFNQI
jgi:hypothetical protein